MALRPLNLSWALTAPLPPLNFVLPGLLPGMLGLIVAPGGTGKTGFALDVAVSTAVGRPTAGGLFPEGVPGKVVFLAGEESDRLLAERLRSIVSTSEHASPHLHENLILLPMSGESCTLISEGRPTGLYDEIKAVCEGARLRITACTSPTLNGLWARRESRHQLLTIPGATTFLPIAPRRCMCWRAMRSSATPGRGVNDWLYWSAKWPARCTSTTTASSASAA